MVCAAGIVHVLPCGTVSTTTKASYATVEVYCLILTPVVAEMCLCVIANPGGSSGVEDWYSVCAEPRAAGPIVYFEKTSHSTTRPHAGMCFCLVDIPLLRGNTENVLFYFSFAGKGFPRERRRSRTRNVNSMADPWGPGNFYSTPARTRKSCLVFSSTRGLTPSARRRGLPVVPSRRGPVSSCVLTELSLRCFHRWWIAWQASKEWRVYAKKCLDCWTRL